MSMLRIFGVSMMVFAIMAVGVSAEAEEEKMPTGLTETQIDSIIDMLASFDVEDGVIDTVRAALEGKEVKVEKKDKDKEKDDKDSKGVPGLGKSDLPDVASDRAKQVMACIRITRVLRHGDSGDDVKELQAYLKERGFFKYPEITGYFGSITEAAVQEYQSSEDIVSSGSPSETGFGQVGPKTRGKIEHATCITGDFIPEKEDKKEEVDENEDDNGDDDDDEEDDDGEDEEDDDDDDEE